MTRKQEWFVVKQTYDWEWVEDLNMFCWVNKTHSQFTPSRATQEEATQDFAELGFKLNPSPNVVVQCQDIKKGKSWTRYIVQCKTNYN